MRMATKRRKMGRGLLDRDAKALLGMIFQLNPIPESDSGCSRGEVKSERGRTAVSSTLPCLPIVLTRCT